jgi:hypothetical protein
MNSLLGKIKQITSSKKSMLVLTFVGLYLLSTGTSWAIFSYIRKEPALELTGDAGKSRSRITPDLPRTEECPINGGMFTEIEKNIWEERRPIATIIENHADSRPPSNLSRADVVYEAVAEGGITRFLAIYYCGAAAEDLKIAPVRSARIYFIDWAAEYGDRPIFMHVGGANDYSGYGDTAREARALEVLESMGWRIPKGNDLDTTYDSGFPVFWRNYERLGHPVATEHTMMASLDAAYEEAKRRGFSAEDSEGNSWDETFVSWKFADDKPATSPSAAEISFEFWSNKEEYDVTWKYDSGGNKYLRVNGGKDYIDLATNEQISAKNVVILFAKERGPVDRNLHMLYTTIAKGDALVFQNGEAIEATWEKNSRTDRTKFFDTKGSEISFVRGTIWIEAVPAGNEVNY